MYKLNDILANENSYLKIILKLKNLLMKVKEESEKSWLKAQHSENEDHGIWSHHFMGNRWGNSGNSD